MKNIIIGMLLGVVGLLLVAAGPPVPSSWFRAGNVSLGGKLYFTDAVTGGSVTGGNTQLTAQPITHTLNSFDSWNSGAYVRLPVAEAVGQIIFLANNSTNNGKYCPPVGGQIDGDGLNTCFGFDAFAAGICFATAPLNWACI